MKRFAHLVALAVFAASVSVGLGQGGGGAGGGGDGGAGAGAFGGGGGGGGGGRGGRGAMGGGGAGGGGFGQGAGGFGQGGGGGGGGGRGGPMMTGINLNFYMNQFDIMSQQLMLSPEQRRKVQEKVDAMIAELETFQQNAQGQLGRGGRGGRGGGGPLQMAKLQDDFQLLANEHQIKIDAELTPDQRILWETYKLNRLLEARLNAMALTEDQFSKIRALVDETAKAIASLTDGKEIQTLEGRLLRKMVGDILTEQQTAKLIANPLPLGGGGRGGGGGGPGGPGGGGAAGGGAGGGPGAAPGGGGRGGRGGRGGGGRGAGGLP